MKNSDPKPFKLKASAFRPFIYCLLVLIYILFTVSSCGKDAITTPPTEQCPEADKKNLCKDSDNDGEGDSNNCQNTCDELDGYVENDDDPDDTNGNITSDCEMVTLYRDEDEDGYGDHNNSITQCSGVNIPTGYVMDNSDCTDDNSQINKLGVTVYADADGDGLGDPHSSIIVENCVDFEGNVLNNSDCDDNLGPFIASEWTGTYNVERTNYQFNGTSTISNFGCTVEDVEGQPNVLKLISFWSNYELDVTEVLYITINPCTQTATWNQETSIGYYRYHPHEGDITWERADFGAYQSNGVSMDSDDDYGWCTLNFEDKTIQIFGVARIPEKEILLSHYKCDMVLVQE
ncbi:hypothetical protein [Flagellimonas algicola]|uniref:Thrombospondin type 3 repeat-containing protein n=1 Tax=Flagellimonas algicola TaxID=2583815 RepID=A0ABY2WPS6_9FLAO|nr:hypothetical protein [Allomuricauda algicola]TMU56682.1 hypothetical protein FGG15_03825 [Allomuricauda algicola]